MQQSLDDILKEMEDTEQNRRDLNIPLDALIMQDDGRIKNDTYGEFEASPATINSLCSRYKLSNNHLQVLKDAGREDLVAETFNHFLINDRTEKKLRIVDDDRIKGIVNKNYKKFDDYHVFTQIGDYLNQHGFGYSLEVLNKDDEYTRIRFMIDDVQRDMGMSDEGGMDNDIVQGGFEVTNSEIGLKSMGINSLLYRQICTNGMIALLSQDDNNEIFYKRGKHFNPFSKRNMLNQGLTNAIEKSDRSIELFNKTKGIKVKDPKDEIIKIGNRYNLGKNHIDSVQDKWIKEAQNNMYGVLNAYTRYGNSFNRDYKNRSKFEFIANDVMEKVAN